MENNESNNNQIESENQKDNTSTVAIVALIFGVLSCLGNLAWGWGSMACIILGVVGIFMSISANKKQQTATGLIALISSIVGTILSGFGIACVVCASIGLTGLACGILSAVH